MIRNQNPNATSAITAEAPKIRASAPSRCSWPAARRTIRQTRSSREHKRQRHEQRDEDAGEGDDDPAHVRAEPVVGLRADPQPGQRLRAPHRQAQQRLDGQQHEREHAVGAPAARAAALGRPAIVHRPGPRAAPDEEPAGVRRIVARHHHEDTRQWIRSTHVSRHNKGKRRRRPKSTSRRSRRAHRAGSTASTQRPKAPWHPFPLIEISVLIGIVCIAIGFFSRDSTLGRHGARARLRAGRARRPGHLRARALGRLPLALARAGRVPGRGHGGPQRARRRAARRRADRAARRSSWPPSSRCAAIWERATPILPPRGG